MKKSKHLKTLRKRESLKMSHHLEVLGAAFCRETGLIPSETSLVTAADDKGTHYYFTQKPADLDVDGLPPQMRELLDLNVALANALDAKDEKGVSACHAGIMLFLNALKI